MTKLKVWLIAIALAIAGITAAPAFLAGSPAWAQDPIQPSELVYLGAFRLPVAGADGIGWTYSGNSIAYYPGGDPGGPDDGFPGSLFATGNDQTLLVSEISIPVPVVSAGKSVDDLNTAGTLQDFTDVLGSIYSYWEQPRVGLAYLGAQGGQDSGKVYYCAGLHLQDTAFEASHGWFNTNLSDSQLAGPWVFGGFSGYVTNDYMTAIPGAWADAYVSGRYIAAGRAREGPWAGGGPGLFAYAPWADGSLPEPGTNLSTVTPLLLYGAQVQGLPEIQYDESQTMTNNTDGDRWRGVSWVYNGDRGAVIFSGTKTIGANWYGFANGVRWDYSCYDADTPPCPEVPDYPYNDRGFWADDLQGQLLFFNPNDLAQVAQGNMQSWQPQPYAWMDLSPYMFDPDYTDQDLMIYKRDFIGSSTFDPDRRLLYVVEQLVEEDGRPLIHVFRVGG